jgi:hypothetical protein
MQVTPRSLHIPDINADNGKIVTKNSAHLDMADNIPVEKDHMGLNKCTARSDPAFTAICSAIHNIRNHAKERGDKKKKA